MKSAERKSSILVDLSDQFARFAKRILVAFRIKSAGAATSPALEQSKDTLNSVGLKQWQWIEISLIAIAFGFLVGQLPPDVNESHYLTKAKHFWNRDWCPGDLFLGSGYAHLLFYLLTGWLTQFVSLSAYAWLGRIVTWFFLAFAFQRLSWRIIPKRGFAILAALLFFVLNDRFQMAGEWIIGGFEGKGFAYGFAILAIERMLASKWHWCWPLLGASSAFHVLVGGWSTLSILFCWICCSVLASESVSARNAAIKSQLVSLLIGFAIALIGILPPLIAEAGVSADVKLAASTTYVKTRIAHHLLFDKFESAAVAKFVTLILLWMILAWNLRHHEMLKRLNLFAAGALGISYCGLMLSGLSGQEDWLGYRATELLRFYWFRLADVALPLAVGLGSVLAISQLHSNHIYQSRKFSAWLFVLLIGAASLITLIEKHQDGRPWADRRALPEYPDRQKNLETYRNWRKVCEWINKNTQKDSVFITPAQQQTFKWYAGRTEVFCWKDIPQDAMSIAEWNRRYELLFLPQQRYEAGLMAYSDDQIQEFGRQFGAAHLVVPQYQVDLMPVPTNLKQIYPASSRIKSTYVVFRLK